MSIMRRELINIGGCFSMYSYGLAIAIGILVFVSLCLRHPWRKKMLSSDAFIQATVFGALLGVTGCRLLFAASNWYRFDHWYEVFYLWDGGLSMLGGIIAILIFMPLYLWYHKIPIFSLFDLAALYAPILHAIARLGCFMAGCCYGMHTNVPWAITYTDLGSEAPLNIALHPTQLYTSIALIVAFFLLRSMQNRVMPGQLLMLYLMCEAAIRFSIDYFRNDHEFFALPQMKIFTVHQWIALALFVASFAGFVILKKVHLSRFKN